jgi:hypothetical protein
MLQLQLILFALHHHRIEQRKVRAQQHRCDPRMRGNPHAQRQDGAPKIKRIARMSVRTIPGQHFLFM